MSNQSTLQFEPEELEALAENMTEIAAQTQKVVNEFLAKTTEEHQPADPDPMGIGRAFLDLTTHMMSNPAKMVESQIDLWNSYVALWATMARKAAGEEVEPLVKPEAGDRRFKDDDWSENVVFDYIKQSYLLTSEWTRKNVHDVEGLDSKTADKVEFYTEQFIDALSPTNFLMTNPKVLRETVESKGENLVKGLKNLLHDLEEGHGQLKISQTDMSAFDVGRNIAVTSGKVVYQNELMQLLHYQPTTDEVFERPLLIIPPWINKFYILDLQPENSFIRWATDQGHSVYVVSWVNPDSELAEKSFEDYMELGPLAAMDAITRDIGVDRFNTIGYCLGGTLLASTLAYMAAKDDPRIVSATYFASLVDFSEPGDLGVFIDQDQLETVEKSMEEKGYLDGAQMATTFNMLRANDLIWSFVINNYLLGKDPFPFDLLYWNADSTRMPSAMHSFYLRNMYLENKLIEPGGVSLSDVPIDLSAIKTPTYVLATREDHIAPWKAVYKGARNYAGSVRFVLAASGHIAGVINPPAAEKYSYWSNTKNPAVADSWLETATESSGSWWPDWQKWIQRKSGKKVEARIPGASGLAALEDAPGSYVQVKS